MSTEPDQIPEGPFTILTLNGQIFYITNQNGQCNVSSIPGNTNNPTPTPTPSPPQN